MNREMILENIMRNYGRYGITEDMVNEVIDVGIEGGLTYEFIYYDMCRKISEIIGEEFFCTSADMAKAFGIPQEDMDRIIAEAREELVESGEDPDQYFWEVPVQRFMM